MIPICLWFLAAAAKEKEEEEVDERKDDDPDGHKGISVEDPIEQAAKLLQAFTMKRHQILDIWLVTFDVAIRRSEYRFCDLNLWLTFVQRSIYKLYEH